MHCFQACAVVGVLSTVLPQIEKRFGLSSFDSGMVAAANDVAAVLFGIFVAHWGNYGNKVRWIGVGGIITGMLNIIQTVYIWRENSTTTIIIRGLGSSQQISTLEMSWQIV